MRVAQTVLRSAAGAEQSLRPLADLTPDWVLVFGGPGYFASSDLPALLRRTFPSAVLLGCSTAGEISAQGVSDGSCTVTAVGFDRIRLTPASTRLASMADSRAAGERIGKALADPGLRAVVVLGPGVRINGSDLVEGIAAEIGTEIPITGGLAGDGGAFARTWTLDGGGAREDAVVAVGFRGDRLDFAHGSFGGWEPFGPARKVTRCDGNVLFELDGEPALEIYKRYLGEHAAGLPASGLLFPFAMVGEDEKSVGLIRTILGVDEATGSLTLAGAIEADGYLKLMHANTDRLVNGAEAAAEAASRMHAAAGDSLAILVSCVGRKLVMGERVEEEVEAAAEVFGTGAVVTGFYSYGEISPSTPGGACRLHNQTMTVTWIGERPGA